MHFSFVVVDGGKEMLAVETDADTVVSGTLQQRNLLTGTDLAFRARRSSHARRLSVLSLQFLQIQPE
jgi:hypothetical protein